MTADSRCDHSSSIRRHQDAVAWVLYCRWGAGAVVAALSTETNAAVVIRDAEYFYRHGPSRSHRINGDSQSDVLFRKRFWGPYQGGTVPLRKAKFVGFSHQAMLRKCVVAGARITVNFGTELFWLNGLRRVNPNAQFNNVTDKLLA